MAALNNKILIGTNDETTASYVFENANIFSVDGEMAIGVIGDELTIDTLTPVVRFIGDSDSLWSADQDSLQSYDEDDLYSAGASRLSITYGTPVWWYNNSVLSGKFYVESVERTGKEQYQLNCISVIGILDTKTHAGAVYTGETFSTVLNSIMNGTLSSSDYEVDSDVASIKVYGYLPYDTARNNLHKLLMAYNVSLVKSESDVSKIKFCFLGTDTATEIPNERIYNDGSVDYAKMPTKVNVTEHTYINWPEGAEETELFNNADSGIMADSETVLFDEPIIPSTIRVEGSIDGTWVLNDDEVLGAACPTELIQPNIYMTFYQYTVDTDGNVGWNAGELIQVTLYNRLRIIDKYYFNISTQQYRKVRLMGWTGTYIKVWYQVALTPPTAGKTPEYYTYNYAIVSGVGKLVGKPYIHQTKETVYSTGALGTENIASLTDNTLITTQNGQNVANRLIDYYGNADTQKVEIKMSGEKIGKKYSFQNAFNEKQTGLLTRITLSISSFIKGLCEIVTGLLYPGKGTLYNTRFFSASNGTWTVPSGVTKVRAVLIGGGNGGDSGYAGEDGEDATTSGGAGGEGGQGGNGGSGGKIYTVDLTVTAGDTITYTIGSGGSGGVGSTATHDSNVAGSPGGNTTITYNGTTYSSASGASSSSGYLELIDNQVYARPSLVSGIKGGNGGKGGSSVDGTYDAAVVIGEDGESVCEFAGGSGGALGLFANTMADGTTTSASHSLIPIVRTYNTNNLFVSLNYSRYHGTGGGGGACATSAGNAGTGASGTGTETRETTSSGATSSYKTLAHGMNGGNGLKPDAPADETNIDYEPGRGGAGGHGGSGGGGGGATNTNLATASVNNDLMLGTPFTINATTELDSNYSNNCKGGSGGAGGNGGKGIAGCVIFYYEA